MYPKYREFLGLNLLKDVVPYVKPKRELSDRTQSDTDILRAIFSLDPISGLPRGDISQYMSEETNPQIAQFIKTKLMQEQTPVGQSPAGKLSDEDLAKFERKAGESVASYVSRLNEYILDDVRSSRVVKPNEIKDE